MKASEVQASPSRGQEPFAVGHARDAPPAQGFVASYLVDNSILRGQRDAPGIAYRFSKNSMDKAKPAVQPAARWDEIVEGVDEGDGWLKVEHYYLPMMHQGVPIITLVEGSERALQPEAPAFAEAPVLPVEDLRAAAAANSGSRGLLPRHIPMPMPGPLPEATCRSSALVAKETVEEDEEEVEEDEEEEEESYAEDEAAEEQSEEDPVFLRARRKSEAQTAAARLKRKSEAWIAAQTVEACEREREDAAEAAFWSDRLAEVQRSLATVEEDSRFPGHSGPAVAAAAAAAAVAVAAAAAAAAAKVAAWEAEQRVPPGGAPVDVGREEPDSREAESTLKAHALRFRERISIMDILTQAPPAPQVAWCLLPSVGTWRHAPLLRRARIGCAAQEDAAELLVEKSRAASGGCSSSRSRMRQIQEALPPEFAVVQSSQDADKEGEEPPATSGTVVKLLLADQDAKELQVAGKECEESPTTPGCVVKLLLPDQDDSRTTLELSD